MTYACSYQIHCVVANVNDLVMGKQHVKVVILVSSVVRRDMTAKAAKYPQNVRIVRGFTWLLPSNALPGLKKVKTEKKNCLSRS